MYFSWLSPVKKETIPFVTVKNFEAEVLHGDQFASLADVCIDEEKPEFPNSFDEKDLLIYCSTWHIEKLFDRLKNSTRKHVLITTNSDVNITDTLYTTKPSCIVGWFAQNVMIDKADLYPIPIGIVRPRTNSAQQEMVAVMQTCAGTKTVERWAYLRMKNRTNYAVRRPVMVQFCWRPWVSWFKKKEPLKAYLMSILQHRFIISPAGNGWDCHRTWEAMYLGSIPIVVNGPWLKGMEGLPLLAVKSYHEVSYKLLKKEWARLKNVFTQPDERLCFSWWKQRVYSLCQEKLSAWNPPK